MDPILTVAILIRKTVNLLFRAGSVAQRSASATSSTSVGAQAGLAGKACAVFRMLKDLRV